MTETLKAHEKAISKVFSNDYVFYIPDYQRPYSWTTDQAGALLEDLLGCVKEDCGDIGQMPAYFLGSIVLIKAETPANDVVDGQQRLTTLTLLLAAIRAHLKTDSDRAQITDRLYEKGDSFLDTADTYRLTLRTRDANFFKENVQHEDGFANLLKIETQLPDSQKNLRDNAKKFDEQLSAMTESLLKKLTRFILQRCYLVVISTANKDSAYRIFSVLNSRGLDLSNTDILKAEIIGGIPDKQQRDECTQKWEDAEDALGRDDFNMLFAHIRTVYRKVKAQETLLKEFRKYVIKVETPIQFINGVLDPMVEAFSELSASTYSAPSHADKVNAHLRWLNRLEFKDWVPPALAYFKRNRENPAAMETFVRDLERLAYYMLVTKKGVNGRIERFGGIIADIEEGKDLAKDSSKLQLTLDEQFQFYNGLDGPIYETLVPKLRTLVLLRLDSLLSEGEATYQYDLISVEHVLPQNPKADSTWLKWFPNETERLQAVHRLGNLALLTRRRNAQASNFDFDKKKETYFNRGGVSGFALTTQVINETEWLPSVVKKRQTELMAVFEKHWRLNDRKSLGDQIVDDLSSIKH